jgi:MYXO-CTERM domain-containing protein
MLVFSTDLSEAATLGGLSGSDNVVLTEYDMNTHAYGANSVALTVGNNGSSTTYSGVMSGGGSLTKTGEGTLTLGVANTYSGATVISEGTLALDAAGSIDGTSGVSLGTGGTFDVSAKGGYTVNNLTGSGDVIGAITISTELAIGNSPGTSDFSSDLTLGAASTYTYEVVGGGTEADFGNVAGNLTIEVGSILDLVQLGTYTVGDKFTLFSYSGTQSGEFAGLADDSTFTAGGGDWLINYNDTGAGENGGIYSNFVTVTAVPEPGAAMLGALGMLAMLRRRRN